MAERVQKQKTAPQKEAVVEEEVSPKVPENAEALKDEMDELLDEIDSVLEVNAAEFVAAFVQKGGQLCRTLWGNVRVGFNISTRSVVQWTYENMRSVRL